MNGQPAVWTLKVQVEAHPEGSVWVASCPALDVASHGATETAALDMLEEALILFFEGCLEHGVLWHELESRGLAPTPNSQLSMEPAEGPLNWLNIPISLAPNPVEPKTAVR